MKAPILLAFSIFLLCYNTLEAQNDLTKYSRQQLDSIYQQLDKEGKRKELLAYGLAMLMKANQDLDKTDTAYAKVLFKVGRGYYLKNNKDSALVYFQAAVNIQKIKIPKHADYATSLNELALLYSEGTNYALAESLYKEILEIRKEILSETHPAYAGTLINLARNYKEVGNYTLAETKYKEARSIFETQKLTNHPYYINCLINLGILYRVLGNYTEAESLYKKALNAQKETVGEKHPNYAGNLINLGNIYRDNGKYADAEPLYVKAKLIFENQELTKHTFYINCLINLGILYKIMGNYDSAELIYKESLKIYKEVLGKKHPSYASSLASLANLYRDMGNYAESEPLYKEALEIYKEVHGEKHLEYLVILDNFAILYNAMKNYALAESLYTESLNVYKEVLGEKHHLVANSLNNLGTLYKEMGKYDLAEPFYKEAVKIYKDFFGEEHSFYINTLINLGYLYEKVGLYDNAQDYFSQVIIAEMNLLNKQGFNLGEKAKRDFFKTIAPYINSIYNFSAFHRTHDSLLILLQDASLSTKGYALAGVSELLPLIKNANDSTLIKQYDLWNYAKYQLGKTYEMSLDERTKKGINIDSLQKLVLEQEAELMRNSTTLRKRLGYDKKRFYYKDLVTNIGKNEVAIDFIRFENQKKDTAWYYALVTQQGWAFPKFIQLFKEIDLDKFVTTEINHNNENYITKPEWSNQVYNLVIKPLEPYLKKKKTIHWSLAGLLNQVAMGTLRDSKGKMVAERFEIHQYGALKDFIFNKEAQKEGKLGMNNSKTQNVLLVGDISFDLEESEHTELTKSTINDILYASRSVPTDSTRGTSRFVRLSGTKIEVENLRNAFVSKKWQVEELQQKQALEERVRAFSGDKAPLVLHFATHGFFIPAKKTGDDNPLLRSGIALAGANRVWMGKPQIEGVEDGLWTAYEVANANLMLTDLVVLSACETARGQIDPHEGVVGLQRSFKIAGVENMLLSLWQVPDKETVELMQEFYKHYLNGEKPSLALRKAQATMRKKYPEPYYWAAFILIE